MTTPSTYRIPLPGGNDIVIEGDFPLTAEEWEFFVHILDVMKPGLIQPAPAAPEGQDTSS